MFSRGGSGLGTDSDYLGGFNPDAGMLQNIDDGDANLMMDLSDDDENLENYTTHMSDDDDALGTGADEIKNLDLIIFPVSEAPLEYNNQGKFRLKVQNVPHEFISIPPHVMKAVSQYNEEMSKQKAGICIQPCIPLLVHMSPIVSLFSSVAVLQKGQTPPVGGIPRAWHARYTSFQYSMYQLKMLYICVTEGLIPFKQGTFSNDDLEKVKNEFDHQTKIMDHLQNERLDQLYEHAVKEGVNSNNIMKDFIDLMESYALQLIHLYEYLIWTVAVAPRCNMKLEFLLTPHEKPILSQLIPSEKARAEKDVNEFFNFKLKLRLGQEEQNAKNGVENTDVRPREMLVQDSVLKSTSARYKELIPLRTLYEYFFFLDADGILTKNQWHWSPQ